jgi:hypothetical protein
LFFAELLQQLAAYQKAADGKEDVHANVPSNRELPKNRPRPHTVVLRAVKANDSKNSYRSPAIQGWNIIDSNNLIDHI